MTSVVYFLRPVGMEGPVKIGCSYRPAGRLAVYAPLSPYPLEIAAEIEGDQKLECRFHTAFFHLHSHHEWFRPAPELTAAIEAIRSGTFDVVSLPEGKSVIRSERHRASWARRKARAA